MPANVETMFSVRETPWHGLGRIIMDAPASREALELAGLDWQVESRNIYSGTGAMIPGYRANVRSTDDAVLGVVSDRYRIVQNEEAFQFTDDLLGEGVTYETAGSLQGGKKVWMLARLPRKYLIAGDQVEPYLVIFNSHDGSSGVKVAMTPIRVVCQNTLNLALNTAKRSWTARHTENVLLRVQDARETLQLDSNKLYENIVYLEMRSRGYEVQVGKLDATEIDFICYRGDEKLYIQVAYLITPADEEREFGNLERLHDNYPKYVISGDLVNLSRNGIIHRNIIDFLLNP